MFAPYSAHRCSETIQNQKTPNDLGLASPSCLDTLQLDDSLQLYLMSSIELAGFMLVNSQSTYLGQTGSSNKNSKCTRWPSFSIWNGHECGIRQNHPPPTINHLWAIPNKKQLSLSLPIAVRSVLGTPAVVYCHFNNNAQMLHGWKID